MQRKTLQIAVLIFLLAFPAFSYAKKIPLLNFSKGEMPTDNANCSVSLSEEHSDREGDFTLRIDFDGKGEGSAGEFQPKKGSWAVYKKAKYIVFNPSDKEVEFAFSVKGAKMTNTPENRKDWKIKLPPGRSEQEVSFEGAVCDDGKTPLDISRIFIWKFRYYNSQAATVYVVKVWLED